MTEAIAAPLLFFWVNLFNPTPKEMTPEQNAMFSMLHAFAGSKDPKSVHQFSGKVYSPEFIKAVQDIPPGGFIMVGSEYGFLTQYFEDNKWEMLPLMFEEKRIFRKPLLRRSA